MTRIAATVALLLAACDAPASDPGVRTGQIALSTDLREISGLAAAGPDSVFAHDDERASIHEINLSSGRVVRRFSLGSPPARGDFEGIAAEVDQIHLVTSDGRIWTAPLGEDGTHVAFTVSESGADCEVEGLSLAPQPGELLILCKEVRGAAGKRLRIYRWSPTGDGRVGAPLHDIDLTDTLGEGRRFAPSGIEWIEDRRLLVIISARDRMMIVLDEAGRLVDLAALSNDQNQPEGVAWLGGRLLVASEGTPRRPAMLTTLPLPGR